MEMLHMVQKLLLESLKCYKLIGFYITSREGTTGTCFPSCSSYCCDTPEAKDMLSIHHGNRVQRPFEMCLVSLNDIQNIITGQLKTDTPTREVWYRLKHILAYDNLLLHENRFWRMQILLKQEWSKTSIAFFLLSHYIIFTWESQSCWNNVQWQFWILTWKLQTKIGCVDLQNQCRQWERPY